MTGLTLLVVAIVGIVRLGHQRRTERLRRRFGPEYDRTVHELGSIYHAEAELEARLRRFERLNVQPLSVEDAERFADAWCEIQRRFVDDPGIVTTDPDRLVRDLMVARGCPRGSVDQRIDDVSVDCPFGVSHYRSARAIAALHERAAASHDDLRQAMAHYRALFDELLEIRRIDPTSTAERVRNAAPQLWDHPHRAGRWPSVALGVHRG